MGPFIAERMPRFTSCPGGCHRSDGSENKEYDSPDANVPSVREEGKHRSTKSQKNQNDGKVDECGMEWLGYGEHLTGLRGGRAKTETGKILLPGKRETTSENVSFPWGIHPIGVPLFPPYFRLVTQTVPNHLTKETQ